MQQPFLYWRFSSRYDWFLWHLQVSAGVAPVLKGKGSCFVLAASQLHRAPCWHVLKDASGKCMPFPSCSRWFPTPVLSSRARKSKIIKFKNNDYRPITHTSLLKKCIKGSKLNKWFHAVCLPHIWRTLIAPWGLCIFGQGQYIWLCTFFIMFFPAFNFLRAPSFSKVPVTWTSLVDHKFAKRENHTGVYQ